jgi:predicted amidohydrolase YtcJ
LAAPNAVATDKADLVLHEGVVLGHPDSDSIAVGDGRIIAHGSFARLKARVGPRTHLVRLAGRTVAPGLIDSHLHFFGAASAAASLQLSKCRTISELTAELRAAAGRTPPGNWIKAFGCDEALLKERRGPTRPELDEAAPRNPLRIRHQTLHASWLNSRAMTGLGIERADFKPPDGAQIVRDGSGKPSGLMIGMEQWLTSRLPRVTSAALEARARQFSRELAAAGVTAFTDATVRNGPEEIKLFAKLVHEGTICQRVALMIGADHLDSLPAALDLARRVGVDLVAAKFVDGAGGADTLAKRAATAFRFGLDCAFHATEVEELEAALAAVEAARSRIEAPTPSTARLRIEHGGLIPPNYLARLAAAGAWVVTNPGFILYRGIKYARQPGLTAHIYRAKSLLDAGVNLAAGTDAPIAPAKPLAAIASAIDRTTLDGEQLTPEEALTTQQAFELFGVSAARLAKIDAGIIAPGKIADLIVLRKDPSTLAPAELSTLHADMMIVDGRIVYEHGRPAAASSDSADLRTV